MEENYMKKILSLGAAAAVLSLTAAVASAAIAPTMTPATPVAGETVTVEIVANGMTQEATTFTVKASDNLTFVSAAPTESGLANFNQDTMKFAWANSSVPADGTVLLTLTYTVDAAADDEVSVALIPDAGFTDISADAVAAVVVDGAATAETDVTAEPSSEEVISSEEVSSEEISEEPSSEEVSSEEQASSEEQPSSEEQASSEETTEDAGMVVTTEETAETPATEDNGNADADNGKDNPNTGVALAVVPAVLAGAAIVVAKKRK